MVQLLTVCLFLKTTHSPQLEGSSIEKAAKGGYVLEDAENPDLIIASTGSEVAIVVEAANLLRKQGKKVRVVSLPCFEVFDIQSKEYKLSVFPDGVPALSVEAMSTAVWSKYVHESYGVE